MNRSIWAWVRVLGGVGILAVLLWRLGTGAFLDGLRVIDGPALALAFSIGVTTTVFSAWRWCLVARGLGMKLSLRGAGHRRPRGPGGLLHRAAAQRRLPLGPGRADRGHRGPRRAAGPAQLAGHRARLDDRAGRAPGDLRRRGPRRRLRRVAPASGP